MQVQPEVHNSTATQQPQLCLRLRVHVQPPFGPPVHPLCHPFITTTHLSYYSFLSLKFPPSPCAVPLVCYVVSGIFAAVAQSKQSVWKIQRHRWVAEAVVSLPTGRLKCKPQGFTKGPQDFNVQQRWTSWVLSLTETELYTSWCEIWHIWQAVRCPFRPRVALFCILIAADSIFGEFWNLLRASLR